MRDSGTVTGTIAPSVCSGSVPGPSSGSVTFAGALVPRIVVRSFVVRSSTATPSSRVDRARSWLAEAMDSVRTCAGLAGVPAPSDDSGAGVIADTVPSVGRAIHRLPLPSNTPPATPGG